MTVLVALAASLSACGDGTFYAEAEVSHVCHSEVVTFQSPVNGDAAISNAASQLGPQHLSFDTAFNLSKSIPSDTHITATLALEDARLSAVTGSTLPTVEHLIIALTPPAGSTLHKLQLVQADAPATAGTITLKGSDVDALQYATSGAVQLGVSADMILSTASIDANLEVCGQLTARYSL